MSGIGFWEVMLVFLIGLMVLGPERLPRVANQLGTWLGQARRMTRVMKRQLEEELNLENNPSIRRATPLPRAGQAPDRAKKDQAEKPGETHEEKDDRPSPVDDANAPGTGVGSDARPTGETPEAEDAATGERDAPAEPAEQPAQERAS